MGVKFGVNPALLSDFFARNIKTHEMEALSKGGRNGYHMLGFVKRLKKISFDCEVEFTPKLNAP